MKVKRTTLAILKFVLSNLMSEYRNGMELKEHIDSSMFIYFQNRVL